MKRLLPIVFCFALILTAEKCKKAETANNETKNEQQIGEVLFQKWMHSREEDDGEVEVYRPQEFVFPPTRGRKGFVIQKDGGFYTLAPGPTDKIEKGERGEWVLDGNILNVKFDRKETELKLEIIKLNSKVLKIKRH